MEKPVVGIFMSMLRTFFSAKSFYQINESSNIFAMESLHKNHNTSNVSITYVLLMATSQEELLIAQDMLIFLLPTPLQCRTIYLFILFISYSLTSIHFLVIHY